MANEEQLLSAFKQRRIEDFQKLVRYQDIDVDYYYGEPDNGTLLNLASRFQGNEQYVFELIQCGARLWRKDEETGKLEIHEIFNYSDRVLLHNNIWNGVYFSSASGNDNANIMKVAVEENDIEAITLLAHSYSMVHDTFNDGRPEAQHLILLQGSIDAVRVFIMYFDVDTEFQKDSQGRPFSCREIILQKYPELEAELPTPSPSALQEILFSYLKNGVPELFVRRVAEISTEILNDGLENISMKTYLHIACEQNYIDVVNALLRKNVHLNELVPHFNQFARNVTPVMVAAFFGHYEIFEKLLIIPEVELQNAGGSGSVLHLVLHGMQLMQDQNYPTDGHRMILGLLLELRKDDNDELLIENRRLNIDHTDKSNRTALHYALKFNNEFAIKLLLRAGAKLYRMDQSILTSISATILEGYFDECVCSSRESFTQSYQDNSITFNYKIFTQLDLYSVATKQKKNFFIIRSESITVLKKLYKHPLTKSLLHLKWHLVRKYYYINLAFYFSFCLALSMYIFQVHECLMGYKISSRFSIDEDAFSIVCDASLWMWVITLPLYIVLILRELFQCFVSVRRYFGTPDNWLEMTMIVLIYFLFEDRTKTHLAAMAILTSWIGFILLLGKQPSLSIYIEMFKTVALNFAKFLLLYSILVASFAYSFFIFFQPKSLLQLRIREAHQNENSMNMMNSWPDLQMSFFKSIIMMTGEFDASDLPLDSNFSYGHVLFILFVFLVSMVLYNLLNGLAVSDTQAIMEDAEIVALISRAKLISQIERLAIRNPFGRTFKCIKVRPLERVYIFWRNKLFGDDILIDEKRRVYVYPTRNNRIEIKGKYFGRMPSTIVKHAEEILEKQKRSKRVKNENQNLLADVKKSNSSGSQHQSVSEQINNLKHEIDAKNATRDEKLLRMLQNVDKRFDQINELLLSVLQEANLLKNKD